MRDTDSADCFKIKKELQDKVNKTGKQDKTCIRIACHELENFYLGDLNAVEKGLKLKNIAQQQNIQKFRKPDTLGNAYQELLRISQGEYQKIQGSRQIAPFFKA